MGAAPIARHPLVELLSGAWNARERLRLLDAELAVALGSLVLLTTDTRLARECELAQLVVA